jgi:hypothetical protein
MLLKLPIALSAKFSADFKQIIILIQHMKKCIVFAPIAEREIDFYLEFAQNSQKSNQGFEFHFISFFQAGNNKITSNGFKVWDLYEWAEKTDNFEVKNENLETIFQIKNLHKLCLHEKVTFGITKTELLYEKYFKYLNAIHLILKNILQSYQPKEILVFQELGGFVAPLSLLYACKIHQIQHVFFEPSFFKGMMNFVENSFISSYPGLSKLQKKLEPEAIKYLENVRQSKALVIPNKDKHHYKDMGLTKLLNPYNFKKLYNKLYIKYVLKQRQEYEWIFNHVFRNVRQFINRKITGNIYSDRIPDVEFIYFPFHVQLDVQLTIRNPEYLDQLSFVGYLSQVLPKRYKLVIKEHPASIGGFNPFVLRKIINENNNVILLNPMVNTYDIIGKSSAIVTINSKVGAEALAMGKPIACMGHGFYWNSEVANKFNSRLELLEWLEKLSQDQLPKPNIEDINFYFSEIFRHSYHFELYNMEQSNLNRFFESMDSYIKTCP